MSTFRSFRILTTLTFALCHLSLTAAQLVNGQFFTQGLAISNAPAPLRSVAAVFPYSFHSNDWLYSDQHAGSNMVISIDVRRHYRIFAILSLKMIDAALWRRPFATREFLAQLERVDSVSVVEPLSHFFRNECEYNYF